MEQSTCFKVLVMANVFPITAHFKMSISNVCHESLWELSHSIINTATLQVVSSELVKGG